MADTIKPEITPRVHPLHGVFLAASVALFLGALLSDLAYGASYQIQWSNFAAWLLAGAMVVAGFSLLWSFITLLRARPRAGWPLATFLLLLAVFVLGLIDCFVHARDAWGIMPDGLLLSAVVTLLVIAATWTAFLKLGPGASR